MQTYIDVLGPLLLLAAFLAALLFVAARVAYAKVRVLNARRDLLRLEAAQHRAHDQALTAAATAAASAVDAVIGLGAGTYETFPPDVRDLLFAAHESATPITGRKINRK